MSDGYFYAVNREELQRYMILSPRDKLEWLKRANLTRLQLPESVRRLHRIFSGTPADDDAVAPTKEEDFR